MPSSRALYALLDIRDNIYFARAFVADLQEVDFSASRLHVYAAARALEIISEASRRLPTELRDRHPHLPWRAIQDAGNFYRYDDVFESYVWSTIRDDLGPLLAAVEHELKVDPLANA